MAVRKKYIILNVIFYVFLVYHFVILILGNVRYHSFNAPEGLCLVTLVPVYMHLFMSYTKGVCLAWYEFWIKLFFGEFYTYDAERMYHRRKRIVLIAVIVASLLAVFATIANIIVNSLMLSQTLFGFIGISALLMLVISIAYGFAVIIRQIKKRWTNDEKGFILFKSLILQNFLVALSIINMLCGAPI